LRHLLWISLVSLGCGGTDTTIDRTFDPCASLTVVPIGATAVQETGITAALELWRAQGVPMLAAGSVVPANVAQSVEIRFEAAAAAFHGLYDDERAIVFINQNITDPDPLAIVVAHELGHAFGLPHIDARVSLMNRGNLVTPPTDGDRAALEALWGSCGN